MGHKYIQGKSIQQQLDLHQVVVPINWVSQLSTSPRDPWHFPKLDEIYTLYFMFCKGRSNNSLLRFVTSALILYFVLIYFTQCTKQIISERFGRGSRTVDLELEAQIDVLRDTKNKYENILRLATSLINHFQSMVQTQQALGDTFTDLSQKSPELQVACFKSSLCDRAHNRIGKVMTCFPAGWVWV